MMGPGGGHSRLPKTLCRIIFLYLSWATLIVGSQGQCTTTNGVTATPPSVTGVTVDYCNNIPFSEDYALWYRRDNSTSPATLSFILSVQKSPRWYAMGFNPVQNSMIGTNAIIFWVDQTTQKPVWDTYHISDTAVSAIIVNNTTLKFKVQPTVTVTSTYNLAFVIQEESDMTFQNFVLGPPSGVPTSKDPFDGSQHDTTIGDTDYPVSTQINYITGSVSVTKDPLDGKRRTHGILNIIGWGVLLPLGAIIARYARGLDPHWFYTHAVFQVVGYAFILAGLITGVNLSDKLPGVNVDDHKGLAVFVFILATLQITAILLRPNNNHKLRRYWNWGHWWLGRIALVVAAVNIFVGIHLAQAGRSWKIGYGVVLALELLLIIILEAWLWFKYIKAKDEERLPQTAMQRQGPSVNGSGPNVPPTHEPTNRDGKL